MTMSHLLRRTKKCCLKLLRKLSINTDQPTSINNSRLSSSRTTKYFKHKTKTTSSTSSSSATITTATTKRRKIASSSPKFKNKKLKSYTKEETSSTTIDDDYEGDDGIDGDNKDNDLKNGDVKRTYNDNEINLKSNKGNRTNKSSQTIRNHHNNRRTSRIVEYKHRNCCSSSAHDTNNNNSSDGNGNFFKFNKDHLKSYFNFYKLSQNNKIITNNLSESRDKNLLNNDFYLNKMFEDDNVRFTDNKIYIDTNNLKSCCSKIQFNNHNINNNNNISSSNNNNNEIIFEKVIYDKNKKYLSHSPTISVVPSPAQSIYDNLNNDNLYNQYKNDFFIFDNKNKSITSLYENHQYHPHQPYDPWSPTTPTKLPQSSHDPFCDHNSCTLTSQSSLSFCSFDNEIFNNDHDHDHRLDTVHNEQIINDPWSAFDLNTFDLKDKSNSMKSNRTHGMTSHRINTSNEGNSYYKRNDLNNWCNNKISSSTLETWIDDEVFDNSFNEELEKRCAVFEK